MLPEQEILSEFPKIELSYENITHKKVFSCQVAFAIPEGVKHFAWFSSRGEKKVCIFMEVNGKTREISKIRIEDLGTYKYNLCKGTIFYGTVFQYKQCYCFSIEDLLQFEGDRVERFTMNDKMGIVGDIFSDEALSNIKYDNADMLFGTPLIFPNFSTEMNAAIQLLSYKISHIHFYKSDNQRSHFSMKYSYRTSESNNRPLVFLNKAQQDVTFLVKPDIQNDIYHLHALDDKTRKEYFHSIAYISDYKTSVMMNGLFRTIKENVNLDALEESDDEDEFQSDKIDKFVDLKKSYIMACAFNYKFKKWMPIKVKENATIKDLVKRNDLLRLEKNRY
jgi:hypothetical protein